jgi:hypothetical protein
MPCQYAWQPGLYVVRSAEEFNVMWDKRGFGYAEPPSAKPEIDFTKITLIGVVLGEAPDSCYGIRTHEMRISESQADVYFQVLSPEPPRPGMPGPMCMTSIRRMTHFVVVPKLEVPVHFFYVRRH